MSAGFESIYLDAEKCIGCTACVQRCPTEAIRVIDGKAIVMRERCVVCGECIRVCPHHAMKARLDALDSLLGKFRHTVALPAPALYGQFPGVNDRRPVLAGLLQIGFDSTFEVSAAADALSAAIRRDLCSGKLPRPVITTACPVILRLVRIRFPFLLPNLLHFCSPMELAARWARRLAAKKTGLPPEDVGCVFISPCAAKSASVKASLGVVRSAVSGLVSVTEVATRLTPVLKNVHFDPRQEQSGSFGVGWALSGGQSTAVKHPNHLAASGIENIIRILEALEDGRLENVDLVELNACYPGCVGGALTVENPFIAKARLLQIMRDIGPVLPSDECPDVDEMRWSREPTASAVLQLDEDMSAAMDKMERIRFLTEELHGTDCGACGAPSCRALAEDIVLGRASADRGLFSRFGEPGPGSSAQTHTPPLSEE